MSVSKESQPELALEDETPLTWYATFKDKDMEAAFNDYSWKAVYA